MSVAYIVLAHRGPELVARTVRRLLADPQARVFLHVDRKADVTAFDRAMHSLPLDRLAWLPRHDTRWGEFSLVAAALEGLRAVRREAPEAGHAVLLSGQCYPLVPAHRIAAELAATPTTSYLEHRALPPEKQDRVAYHYIRLRGWRRRVPPIEPAPRLRGRALDAILMRALALPRRPPPGMTIRFGSQWWILARPAVDAVLSTDAQRRDVVRYFARCDVPDEMFFQSLLTGGVAEPGGPVVAETRHYMRWSDPGAPSPDTLGVEDVPAACASGRWFARKFLLPDCSEALDAIDARSA